MAGASEQKPEIVVNFSGSSHGAARVARIYFLLDGDGRGQAFYVVGLRFRHASEKLAGVGRQTLDISTLAFGIKRVECQRRLAAATQAGDDCKFAALDLNIDAFQVIYPGSFDYDIAHSR